MDTTLGTEVNARNRQAMPQSGTTVAEEQSKRKSKVSQGGHPDSVANIAKGESVTNRAGESVSPNHRPTRDSFVRETPEDRASYGFYKQVPDGNGSQTIHFEKPTADNAEGTSAEVAPANQGQADATVKDAKADASATDKKAGSKSQGATVKSAQIKALEKQKAHLEKSILLCKDSREKKKLSLQLAQVKRKLKARTR